MASLRKRRTPVMPVVFDYMTANSDRALHCTAIAEELGLLEGSVSSALSKMTSLYPQLRRTQKGVYIWDSSKTETTGPEEYLLRVLSCKGDGTKLVLDEERGDVFVMKPVEY